MIVPRTNPNLITFWLATPISTHCQGPDLTLNFLFAARAATFLFFLVECNRRCAMWIMSYPSKDVLNGSCSPWRLVTADRQNMWKKLQLINWRKLSCYGSGTSICCHFQRIILLLCHHPKTSLKDPSGRVWSPSCSCGLLFLKVQNLFL